MKKYLVLFLILMVLFSVVGCTQQNAGTNQQNNQTTVKQGEQQRWVMQLQ